MVGSVVALSGQRASGWQDLHVSWLGVTETESRTCVGRQVG